MNVAAENCFKFQLIDLSWKNMKIVYVENYCRLEICVLVFDNDFDVNSQNDSPKKFQI